MESGTQTGLTRRLRRLHNTGTQAELSQYTDGWRMQISLKEPNHSPMTITSYMAPSVERVERAKEVADSEIAKYGHVCNEACKDWVEVS